MIAYSIYSDTTADIYEFEHSEVWSVMMTEEGSECCPYMWRKNNTKKFLGGFRAPFHRPNKYFLARQLPQLTCI
jgi:hypothetical protein